MNFSSGDQHYTTIGLGGTFDHFHLGHEYFLKFAASLADHLKIGLTTTTLTQHKLLSQTIQPFAERKANLNKFLSDQHISAEIFELEDISGPALQPNFVQALAVTEVTQKGGEEINQLRAQKNLPALPLHVCSLLKDENGEFISSTRIRQGIINRSGKVYLNLLGSDKNLNSSQRAQLKEKQGQVVTEPSQTSVFSFVIGDIVLETFRQKKWPYQLGIFDGKTQRNRYTSAILENILPDIQLTNPSGQISSVLAQHIAQFFTQLPAGTKTPGPHHIFIDGEEDLAAVCVVLLAPLDSAVYYGQPGEGMVEVLVTEEKKEKFWTLIHSS